MARARGWCCRPGPILMLNGGRHQHEASTGSDEFVLVASAACRHPISRSLIPDSHDSPHRRQPRDNCPHRWLGESPQRPGVEQMAHRRRLGAVDEIGIRRNVERLGDTNVTVGCGEAQGLVDGVFDRGRDTVGKSRAQGRLVDIGRMPTDARAPGPMTAHNVGHGRLCSRRCLVATGGANRGGGPHLRAVPRRSPGALVSSGPRTAGPRHRCPGLHPAGSRALLCVRDLRRAERTDRGDGVGLLLRSSSRLHEPTPPPSGRSAPPPTGRLLANLAAGLEVHGHCSGRRLLRQGPRGRGGPSWCRHRHPSHAPARGDRERRRVTALDTRRCREEPQSPPPLRPSRDDRGSRVTEMVRTARHERHPVGQAALTGTRPAAGAVTIVAAALREAPREFRRVRRAGTTGIGVCGSTAAGENTDETRRCANLVPPLTPSVGMVRLPPVRRGSDRSRPTADAVGLRHETRARPEPDRRFVSHHHRTGGRSPMPISYR